MAIPYRGDGEREARHVGVGLATAVAAGTSPAITPTITAAVSKLVDRDRIM
jgi:hypothetical protein